MKDKAGFIWPVAQAPCDDKASECGRAVLLLTDRRRFHCVLETAKARMLDAANFVVFQALYDPNPVLALRKYRVQFARDQHGEVDGTVDPGRA